MNNLLKDYTSDDGEVALELLKEKYGILETKRILFQLRKQLNSDNYLTIYQLAYIYLQG